MDVKQVTDKSLADRIVPRGGLRESKYDPICDLIAKLKPGKALDVAFDEVKTIQSVQNFRTRLCGRMKKRNIEAPDGYKFSMPRLDDGAGMAVKLVPLRVLPAGVA